MPKRNYRGDAFRSVDQHAIGFNAVDAPGVGAQQERIADATFVDEFSSTSPMRRPFNV